SALSGSIHTWRPFVPVKRGGSVERAMSRELEARSQSIISAFNWTRVGGPKTAPLRRHHQIGIAPTMRSDNERLGLGQPSGKPVTTTGGGVRRATSMRTTLARVNASVSQAISLDRVRKRFILL